jgi:hypothetical protein
MDFSNLRTLAAVTFPFLGSPTSLGVRISSAKRSVSARRMPFSAKIATRYSFPRITKVAIPALRLFHGCRKQPVCFLGCLTGNEEVGSFKVQRRNLIGVDKPAQIDGTRPFRSKPFKFLVRHDDVFIFLDLVPANQLFIGKLTACNRRIVPSRQRVSLWTEHAERNASLPVCGKDVYRYADQTERNDTGQNGRGEAPICCSSSISGNGFSSCLLCFFQARRQRIHERRRSALLSNDLQLGDVGPSPSPQ